MNEQNSLFFIPDISGFTRFINETEISHSRHIISELLELVIDSNRLGMDVSEIEGDAVFFHRFGPAPAVSELAGQAKEMFIKFHQHLKKYEQYRLCQCGACKSAHSLTLKIIAHYGHAQNYKVKEHSKLIGADVITVHRLLKNNVQHNEYVLITDNVPHNSGAENIESWFNPENGEDSYDDIGNITYKYSSLSPLLDEVQIEEPEDHSLKDPHKIYELEEIIYAPMEDIFAVMIDLPIRDKWMPGVKKIIVYDKKMNHLGTVHKCLQGDGDPDIVTDRVNVTGNTMEFWETAKNKVFTCRYYLEKKSDEETLIKFEAYVKNSVMVKTMTKLFMMKRLTKKFIDTVKGLKTYCENKKLSDNRKN
jgi:uncharacterized protein DUF2652